VRPKTKKRAAIDRKAKPVRDALVERVGVCEYCGQPAYSNNPLVAHEVTGGGIRAKSQAQPCGQLVLHYWNCHPKIHTFSKAKQLAILKHRRQEDFDIEAYYLLIDRRFPDEEDIETELNQLISDEVHE
jgi:hypothetical protein